MLNSRHHSISYLYQHCIHSLPLVWSRAVTQAEVHWIY